MVELGVDTLSKRRLLLEASDYGEGEAAIVATSALCAVGPALAGLVLTLAEQLATSASAFHSQPGASHAEGELKNCGHPTCEANLTALAAVEELRL